MEKSGDFYFEKEIITSEQQEKIKEIRQSLGPLPEKLDIYCSDASIARHLRARNWNIKKALKMICNTLKWRTEFKPEEIHWDDVAKEGETGKIYRSKCFDKYGRSVLIMRPRNENSKSVKGNVKYLSYCMENAIMNLSPDQEQMVWLIDFEGYSLANVSLKITRETAHVLQDHYPERLGLAILYNPPKFFQPFFEVAKVFLEQKTYRKVKFVYSDDANSHKIMSDLFDMNALESCFGGNNSSTFNLSEYAEMMREDDKRMTLLWTRKNLLSGIEPPKKPHFEEKKTNSDDSSKEHVKDWSDDSSEDVLTEENCNGHHQDDVKSCEEIRKKSMIPDNVGVHLHQLGI